MKVLKTSLACLCMAFASLAGLPAPAPAQQDGAGYDPAADPLPFPEIFKLVRERKCDALKAHPDYEAAIWPREGDRPAERMILEGICFEADPELARQMLEDRVATGTPANTRRSAALLGRLLEEGIGGPVDSQRAEQFYWEAAVMSFIELSGESHGYEDTWPEPQDNPEPQQRWGVNQYTYEAELYDPFLGPWDVPARYQQIATKIKKRHGQGLDGILFLHESFMHGANGFPRNMALGLQWLEAAWYETGDYCHIMQRNIKALEIDTMREVFNTRHTDLIVNMEDTVLILLANKDNLTCDYPISQRLLGLVHDETTYRSLSAYDPIFYYLLKRYELRGGSYYWSAEEIEDALEPFELEQAREWLRQNQPDGNH